MQEGAWAYHDEEDLGDHEGREDREGREGREDREGHEARGDLGMIVAPHHVLDKVLHPMLPRQEQVLNGLTLKYLDSLVQLLEDLEGSQDNNLCNHKLDVALEA